MRAISSDVKRFNNVKVDTVDRQNVGEAVRFCKYS